MDKLEMIKDKFLQMDLVSKRLQYVCSNYVTLEEIKPWAQYAKENPLHSSIAEEEDEKVFSVDDEINSKVSLWQGDITTLEVDAIVNAANTSLLGGGGVDGAIHNGAGEDLLKECETLNGCDIGCAKITGGYKLPAKYVIHTVGPQEKNASLLRSAYISSLELMLEKKFEDYCKSSIRSHTKEAFPCISTGIYGYPIEDATHVALITVRKFMEENNSRVDRVIFTTFSDGDRQVYEDYMQRYFPVK